MDRRDFPPTFNKVEAKVLKVKLIARMVRDGDCSEGD